MEIKNKKIFLSKGEGPSVLVPEKYLEMILPFTEGNGFITKNVQNNSKSGKFTLELDFEKIQGNKYWWFIEAVLNEAYNHCLIEEIRIKERKGEEK